MTRLVNVIVTLAVCASACSEPPSGRILVVQSEPGVDLAGASVSPESALTEVRRLSARYEEWVVGPSAFTVNHPDACSERVEPGTTEGTLQLRNRFAVADADQVGFDAPFSLEVSARCSQGPAEVTWHQVEGDRVRDARPDGMRLSGRSAPFVAAEPGAASWGILPVSRLTQGLARYEVRVREGEYTATLSARVTASNRATGLPSVPLSHSVELAGEGWRIVGAPEGASPRLDVGVGRAHFAPDRPGDYRLEDAHARPLSVKVASHGAAAQDCARADCHREIAAFAADSPMTTVFTRGLHGQLGDDYDPTCVMGCHTTGEPGVKDGGFSAVLAELGGTLDLSVGRHVDLPPALARSSGVTCTACHGPSSIPPQDGRWAVLRSDVCAVCHDAPPRYGHVAAWRASAMARSDRHPGVQHDERCAACHTTAGFLARLGLRTPLARSIAPPGTAPLGIACAACHAPHGPVKGPARLREVTLTVEMPPESERSEVCVPCHFPETDASEPRASAAAIWLGVRGAPGSSRARETASPHRAVPGGCVGCHRAGPAALERGAAHAFAVDRGVCDRCHREPPKERLIDGRSVAERAGALLEALGGRPHGAAGDIATELPTETDRARALWNARLVAEDGAAGFHNAGFARRLLDEAEAHLARGKPR